MALIYRSMLAEEGKPQVGASAMSLGARVPTDIMADASNLVYPGTGGMSVAPDWRQLPPHLIPRRLKHLAPRAAGKSELLHVWQMGGREFVGGALTADLQLRPDPRKPAVHGFIEPARPMTLDEFQAALAATRDDWSLIDEDRP